MKHFNYTPNNQQLKQLACLKTLVEECRNNSSKISVYGGYGLDGLLGELTRDHHDIDILVEERSRGNLKVLLNSIGFTITRENDSKEVFKSNDLGDEFQIEVNKQNRLEEFTNIGVEKIFTNTENANLNGFTFNTPTIEGHTHIQKMQLKRAKDRGWESEYIHKVHTDLILDILGKR